MLLRVRKNLSRGVNTAVREFKIRYLPVSHTSRTNDQDPLLDLLLTISNLRTRTICFTERLVNCSHCLDNVEGTRGPRMKDGRFDRITFQTSNIGDSYVTFLN